MTHRSTVRRNLQLAAAALVAASACGAPRRDAGSRAPEDAPPAPIGPLPSPQQLAWHDLEFCAFVHFNMNTFTDAEWGSGKESPSQFQPTQLDCRQWASVAREAGMRGIILTAKHHDGFCLWPSKYTNHTVASSAWRGGKGDVVRELSDACAGAGLNMGVYISPWDRNSPLYGDSPKYNQHFKDQLTELLGGAYGRVFEVWFDGACGEGPNGKKQEYDWPGFISVVRRLQPNAVIFSDAGPDVRWVGNEDGFAGETCWATLRRDEFYPGTPNSAPLTEGQENGSHWVPAECDVSIRPAWYYHEKQDGEVKSLAKLLEIWHGSVGRGANLLLNLPVDRRGLVHENDAARLRELRAALDAIYRDNLAAGATATATASRAGEKYQPASAVDGGNDTYWSAPDGVRSASLELALAGSKRFDRILLREPIALGQRIRAFAVDAWTDGAWREIARGTTVGHKRIVTFPAVDAQRVRVRIADARACPLLSSVELYCAPR